MFFNERCLEVKMMSSDKRSEENQSIVMCRGAGALGRGFGARSNAEVTLELRHEQ